MIPWLDRLSLAATLVLPAFIMHGRGIADGLIALAAVLFLLRSALVGDWAWLGTPWLKIAALWWGWQVVCSLPFIGIGGTHSLVQALVMVRFVVFVAALEHQVLATAPARRWLQHVITASTLYIAGQTWLQFTIGRNIQGFPRWGDGELTGPFLTPRAAAPLSRLLFPAMLPWIERLLGHGRRFGAIGLAIAGIGTVVLIGQRMPLLLTILGLVVTALMLPSLRRLMLQALAAGALLLAATPVVSPPTFYRLVTKFTAQMEHFPDSDYGLIYTRAAVITADNPFFGQGFDGFRNACPDPRYFRGLSTAHPDGAGAAICNIHPHNHYAEAATNAGIPGLVLFCTMIVTWLRALARNLGSRPDPLRVGLFVAVLIQEWPLASASGFSAVEIAGFFFLLLGYGLALARAADSTAAMSPEGSTPIT